MSFSLLILIALTLCAPILSDSTNFGSYIGKCVPNVSDPNGPGQLVFLNFPAQDCLGSNTQKSYVTNTCLPELSVFSYVWKW